jgi:hypothetical protein
MDAEREILTWQPSGEAPRDLARAIADDGFGPDLIMSVARGGLYVAGSLGYALGVKNLHVMNVEFYGGVGATLDMPVMLPPVPSKVTRLGVDHALHDRRPLRPRRQPAVLDAHLQPNLNPSPPQTTEPPSPDPSFRRAKAGRRRNSPRRADRRVSACYLWPFLHSACYGRSTHPRD